MFKSTESELKLEPEFSKEDSLKVRFKVSWDPSAPEGKKVFTVTKGMIRRLFEAGVDASEGAPKQWVNTANVLGKGRATTGLSVYKRFYMFAEANGAFASPKNEEALPHVLIMDEINRGNLSAIFGELITLIEDGKRAGQSEAIAVTLPYSQEKFSLPANLYKIGTMNTADRSVEALDTALRRRFVFREMMPEPDLLDPGFRLVKALCKMADIPWEDERWLAEENALALPHGIPQSALKPLWEGMIRRVKEAEMLLLSDKEIGARFTQEIEDLRSRTQFNLSKILNIVNRRLTYLKDRNHTLGHAFFMECTTAVSVISVFAEKLVPLLEEFFYAETVKIGLVLSPWFLAPDEGEDAAGSLFAGQGRFELVSGLPLEEPMPRRSLTGPELLAAVGGDEQKALGYLQSILL